MNSKVTDLEHKYKKTEDIQKIQNNTLLHN